MVGDYMEPPVYSLVITIWLPGGDPVSPPEGYASVPELVSYIAKARFMKNSFAEKRGFRLALAALPPRCPVG